MDNIKNKFKKYIPSWVKNTLKKGLHLIRKKKMLRKYKTVLPYNSQKYENGINLIGDIQAETGLGQSMRILASVLEKNDIPFDIVQISQPGDLKSDNHEWDYRITTQPKYNINLLHINASEWAEDYNIIDKKILDYRKNIAYWLWELEEFPRKWQPCIETVDEIWAPSEFVCNSVRKCTDKSVRKLPYAIEVKKPEISTRTYFGLPNDAFLYLAMYDCHSISERKNPQGMIRAFQMAFTPEYANSHKIGMILKVNHGEYENKLNTLKKELREYRHIYFITDVLTREEVYALEAVADVLISLHRSEGFGLAVAEAMSLGTAVITTNWSATTEFTTEETACLVDYDLVVLEHAIGPYARGSRWADAHIDHAAGYMRKLYENPEFRMNMEIKAQNYIHKYLNASSVGRILNGYLDLLKGEENENN